MVDVCRCLWSDESGQDLVEYTLVLVLIALAVVAGLQLLGTEINNAVNNAASQTQGNLNS